jgi:hypothetical protein
MSNFDNNWRRQQELKMRPYADIIYKNTFGAGIDINRFDRDEDKALDIIFAIDVQIGLENGQILLGQEKYLSDKYAGYKSITVEYEQNQITHEHGDWYKLATQFYFTGYCNKDMTGFDPWVIANWTSMIIETLANNIHWVHNNNKADGARASFVYTNMTQLPESCIIAKSW